MGYYIEHVGGNFRIPADKKAPALKALRELKTQKGYEHDHANAASLEEAMKDWNWEAVVDGFGNIVDLNFLGEKLRDDELMFQAIAPFVDKESNVEIAGSDNECWRWHFNGTTCVEQVGHTEYDET